MTKRTSEAHSSLFHYTNWLGLQGIFNTQSLWATNIRYLNDEAEYLFAKLPISEMLHEQFARIIQQKIRDKPEIELLTDKSGGLEAFSRSLARNWTDAIYRATGDDFYVVSFCGQPEDNYVFENGLLSQWRAYGSGGGFAIMFDTAELEKLLEREASEFSYASCHLSDAIYSNDEKTFEDEFKPLALELSNYVEKLFYHLTAGSPMPEGSAAMSALIQCSTRYKHRGFNEEKEVRIVLAPNVHTEDYVKEAKALGVSPGKEKPVDFRDKSGKPIPYIKIFNELGVQLPIKGILVGPGQNKRSAAEAVQRLVRKQKIRVSVSDIPYV